MGFFGGEFGLKKFSNWPTFPQLYCKGELLGGCDIAIASMRVGNRRKFLKIMELIPLMKQKRKNQETAKVASLNLLI